MNETQKIKQVEEKLNEIANRLKQQNLSVSLRGSGMSMFLLIDGKNKSVELSFDEDDFVWVEFWDGTGDDAKAIKDETYKEFKLAEAEIIKWCMN